jgi:hypothetical protein
MPSSTSSSSLRPAAIIALFVTVIMMSSWEAYWRSDGSVPGYRNDDGLWAIERRRINDGEGDGTVIIGSSRIYFDTQLDAWEQESGERPIQLAQAGTSPLTIMEDLANDPDFTGSLVVGVAPQLIFTGFETYSGLVTRYERETPTQWLGQRISMLVEPYLAFYQTDYSLFTVIRRQPWPAREGVFADEDVRRLAIYDKDRNARLYTKVLTDDVYLETIKRVWMQYHRPIDTLSDEEIAGGIENRGNQIARAVAAVEKLNARGIDVTFVRNPSEGHYDMAEPMYFPRAEAWDVLIADSGELGIHWLDHEELQGFRLAEWSHMEVSEAERYTKALYHVIQRERALHSQNTEE